MKCFNQVYLFVDQEAGRFSLSKQSLGSSTLLPKSSAECPPPPALSKTDKGLIAVGVVLGVLVFGLIAYGIFKWLMKGPARLNETDLGRDTSRPDMEGPHVPGTPSTT